MKRLLLCLLSAVCLCSCSQTDFDKAESVSREAGGRYGTRADGSGDSYVVTEQDIEAYIAFKKLESKNPDFEVKSVTPFPDDENPAMYIINYADYWELLSTDKRTPAVIATAPGEFNTNRENDNFMAWTYCIAEELSALKSSDKTDKKAEIYAEFWKYVTCDKDFLDSKLVRTRSDFDTTYHPYPGHYELEGVDHFVDVVDSIDHLITTRWSQYYPYNQFCPLYSIYGTDTVYCATGCVALAGAQMVYYLHYNNNLAPQLYDSAYCNTCRHPLTDWSQMRQWHMTSTAWNKFQTADSARIAAILLANLGKSIRADYGYPSTSALTNSLSEPLLDDYGIPTIYDDYDAGTVLDLLITGYPTIVRANDLITAIGHAFIIDKYKQIQNYYNYYYVFVPDEPSILDDYTYDYMYSTPVETYFGVNWCMDGSGGDILFNSEGDWHVSSSHYNYSREMLIYCPEE